MAFRTDSAAEAEAISAFEVDWPVRIKAGPGALDALPACLDRYGWRKPFVVIDPGLATTPFLARIRRLFDVSENGTSGAGRPQHDRPAIFTDVRPDAELAGVDALRRALTAAEPDVVVTIGGGSAIDTAKAALVAAAGAQLVPFAPPPTAPIPHVAVPTTAGTGSEVSPAAVVRDPAAKRKYVLRDRHLWPALALLDPELTRSLPPSVTAATAMDALSHAAESSVATLRNPLTEAFALQAARMIAAAAPAVIAEGSDLNARQRQQVAATLAGLSMRGGLGAAHALSHALGGRYRVVHGIANGILLPHVIRFNGCRGADYRPLAAAFGCPSASKETLEAAADDLARSIEQFRERLGLPPRLRDLDLPRAAAEELVSAALDDACMPMNPAVLEAADVVALYDAAW